MSKLPEGWVKQSERFYFRSADRKACVTRSWDGTWRGILEAPDGLSGYAACREIDAHAAMRDLNEKYPLGGERNGEG